VAPRIHTIRPTTACDGGRVTLLGDGFDTSGPDLPDVRFGDARARVTSLRASRLIVSVPTGAPAGPSSVRVNGEDTGAVVHVGARIADGLHQVDSPVFDSQGRLYVTYSGARGQQVPVSIFRIMRDGTRDSYVAGLVNPTAMAIGPDGALYVSSRFEGVVYRVDAAGFFEPAVSDVGVACGLAFAPDGTLLVGDRSGTIFRVLPNQRATLVATLPPSVAAFHLAMSPDGVLYVTAPTLTSRDHVYRVTLDGQVDIAWSGFGRPQGLAFGPDGYLYVADALAGASGLYRLRHDAPSELVVSGEGLVGVAFDPLGGLVVTSNEVAWRIDELRPPVS
jgi:sugar lactone lactonase YvrE